MIFSYEILLLLLVLVTAVSAIMVKDLMSSVLLLGSYSFFLALAWACLGAVDVAFVEAVVGAGLATVLFLLTLFSTNPKDTRLRRPPVSLAKLIIFPLLGVLLLYAASDLPGFGDPNSPASVHISPTYLEQSYQDTLTPNVVTSVLMDYRSLDTMIETVVIFSASSSGISIPNSSSNSMISSTVSSESAPRSLTKCASEVIADSSTPSLSMITSFILSNVAILSPYVS